MEILILPGDGIGPEICDATDEILAQVDRRYSLGLRVETADVGLEALRACGTTMPASVMERARAVDAIVLGPVSHKDYPPVDQGGVNPSAELRKRLDLFANIRPTASLPASIRPIDVVLVRENTEGFYADRNMAQGSGEFAPTEDVVLAVRKVTRKATQRVARVACELAINRNRRVTIVHKANVLRMSDGLFLEESRQVAREYPQLAVDDVLVDAMAALLVRAPAQFDVIVTTNMFGDILSNIAAEVGGGLGAAASINAGEEHVMAQAAHGSAPELAGLDVANPLGLIGSAAMMLQWLGRKREDARLSLAGREIASALTESTKSPSTRTRDIGGSASTSQVTAAILACLEDRTTSR